MSEPIEELTFDIHITHIRGEVESYTYDCPTFVEMGQKINEIIRAINKMSQNETS